jgi:uncharacterized protein (TIGR01777 family)
MHILITGGTGFIGTPLVARLVSSGHTVTVLSRQALASTDPVSYISSLDDIGDGEAVDAIINLAGASLAAKRWSTAYKEEIFSSRLDTTRELLAMISRLEQPPAVLLSASAIGVYGHHGDEILDEDGLQVAGFAQSLCSQWEALALEAQQYGVRVCLLRLGVVLDEGGGAFSEMARPFRLGIANWMGDGHQWLSWVHRQDVLAALEFLLEQSTLSGPFNITGPDPVTSRGFCDAMKRRRRTLLTAPVPAVAMRLLVGEMADELLLNGQRVVPAALQAAGFEFRYETLDQALEAIL